MNEYSLSPPFPDPSMNLSTEHPQGPMRRTDLKAFLFQLRSVFSWELADLSWLSLVSPLPYPPKEHIPQSEEKAPKDSPKRRDWAVIATAAETTG